MDESDRHGTVTRRQAIAGAAVLGLGAAGGAYALLRDGDDSSAPGPRPATEAGAAPDEAACVLSPEQTEGPYYIEDSIVRSDVTEGREGVPLELALTVQDADSCEPIEDATVEIWHCDALGAYSGVQGDDQTFLRGGQRTDADGRVTFNTIYPGWYQGRATHIHVKVHAGGNEVHTGQLYFEDQLNERVAGEAPYRSRGAPETTNAADGIYGSGGKESTLRVTRAREGYAGSMTLGVRA